MGLTMVVALSVGIYTVEQGSIYSRRNIIIIQLQTVNAIGERAPEVSFNVLSLFVLIFFTSAFRRVVATRLRSTSLAQFFSLANPDDRYLAPPSRSHLEVDTNDTQTQ